MILPSAERRRTSSAQGGSPPRGRRPPPRARPRRPLRGACGDRRCPSTGFRMPRAAARGSGRCTDRRGARDAPPAGRLIIPMASAHQISVGGVAIGGGAPVVVQSMTLTYTHDVDATMEQIGSLASAGCEVVRVAVPKSEDADALEKLVYLSPLPIIARHPLQRLARAACHRRGRGQGAHQPGQHRWARQGGRGRAGRKGEGHPDADRRELRLASEAPRRARAGGHPRPRSSTRRSSRSSCSSRSTTATSRSR